MRKLLAMALSAAMMLSLVSCASDPAPAPAPVPDASAPSGSVSTPAEESIELKFWAFNTFGIGGEYEEKLIADYTAMNPHVSIELVTLDFTSGPEQLTSAIKSETAPDILLDAPGRIIEYGRAGQLVSMDDMFTAEFVADVGNEALLDACKADGTAYMYPLSVAPFYMGLNLNMLEAADALQYVNLEGDRTWSTEDFQKMTAALRDAGVAQTPGIVYCGGQGGDQGTRALVNNLFSSQIVDANSNWNIDEKGIESLTLLQEMVADGSLDVGMSYAAKEELEQFQMETTAMSFCWGTSNAINYASDDFTAVSVPFPSDDSVPELEYLANGFCAFDNGDAAKAAAAKDFIAYVCDDATAGPESVLKTGAFPVRQSFGNLYEGNEEMSLLSSWTQYYGSYYNTLPNFSVMRTEWWNLLQRTLSGGDVATEVAIYNTNANAQP